MDDAVLSELDQDLATMKPDGAKVSVTLTCPQVHWLRELVAQRRQANLVEAARFALGVGRAAIRQPSELKDAWDPAVERARAEWAERGEPELRYQEVELSPEEILALQEGRYTPHIGARVVSVRAVPNPYCTNVTRYWVLLEFSIQPRTAYRG